MFLWMPATNTLEVLLDDKCDKLGISFASNAIDCELREPLSAGNVEYLSFCQFLVAEQRHLSLPVSCVYIACTYALNGMWNKNDLNYLVTLQNISSCQAVNFPGFPRQLVLDTAARKQPEQVQGEESPVLDGQGLEKELSPTA